MKLFFGLGNPGKKYEKTRHNIGQMVISRMVPHTWFKAAIGDTYMNESGFAVQKIVNFYKIPLENLYLIHDDLDLPVGEYRIQFDRGPAGHNGVKSTIEQLGSQAFWRIRIGISHPPENIPVEDYVLKPFTAEEKVIIDNTIDKILEEIEKLGH